MLDLAGSLRSLTSDVMKKLNSVQERKNGRDTETSRDAMRQRLGREGKKKRHQMGSRFHIFSQNFLFLKDDLKSLFQPVAF